MLITCSFSIYLNESCKNFIGCLTLKLGKDKSFLNGWFICKFNTQKCSATLVDDPLKCICQLRAVDLDFRKINCFDAEIHADGSRMSL